VEEGWVGEVRDLEDKVGTERGREGRVVMGTEGMGEEVRVEEDLVREKEVAEVREKVVVEGKTEKTADSHQ
jgi:hypothetical protein